MIYEDFVTAQRFQLLATNTPISTNMFCYSIQKAYALHQNQRC